MARAPSQDAAELRAEIDELKARIEAIEIRHVDDLAALRTELAELRAAGQDAAMQVRRQARRMRQLR